jgi:hypothetical protein
LRAHAADTGVQRLVAIRQVRHFHFTAIPPEEITWNSACEPLCLTAGRLRTVRARDRRAHSACTKCNTGRRPKTY